MHENKDEKNLTHEKSHFIKNTLNYCKLVFQFLAVVFVLTGFTGPEATEAAVQPLHS